MTKKRVTDTVNLKLLKISVKMFEHALFVTDFESYMFWFCFSIFEVKFIFSRKFPVNRKYFRKKKFTGKASKRIRVNGKSGSSCYLAYTSWVKPSPLGFMEGRKFLLSSGGGSRKIIRRRHKINIFNNIFC